MQPWLRMHQRKEERIQAAPLPHPVPSPLGLRPCSPAGCSMLGGCSWALGKHHPLGPVVGSPVALLTSLPGVALITGQQGPQVSLLAARGRSSSHSGSKSVFLAGTGHLGSGCNIFLKGGAALSYGLARGRLQGLVWWGS